MLKSFLFSRSYDYFSFKALESHLIKIDGQAAERPQHLLMRVAIGIHKSDLQSAIETYRLMSQRLFVHDSNTLLHGGTTMPFLSTGFLLTMKEDSLPGIYDTLKQVAIIMKKSNDLSLAVHCIRSADSFIAGSMGYSNGLVSMIKVFNESSNYLAQNDLNGQKQSAYLSIFVEPWHADIFEYLDLKKSTGEANLRAKDLCYSLWVPDLFMQRVKDDKVWSLMCANQSPGLHEVHGTEFVELYEKYERTGKFKRQIRARELWNAIISSQIENGTPSIFYKDYCNAKSNQQNLGTIKSSNLNAGAIQFSSPEEIAVCQSASIALHRFVDVEKRTYNFERLKETAKIVAKNLDKAIDASNYPLIESEKSNKRHRPIAVGVQGLADALMLMRFAFDSEEARQLNVRLFESIYFGALEGSCELAEANGYYESYPTSLAAKGKLQFDLWNVQPISGLWDWNSLRNKIRQHGLRNSLLMAQSCSAISAAILGCNQCCEPFASVLQSNETNTKANPSVNQYLLNDLIDLGLWDDSLLNELVQNDGDVQKIARIPDELKALYKTVWQIPQKTIINLAADRGPFIDQSQPLNVHMEPTYDKLTSMHFYAWQKGLKTGLHHLKTNQNKFLKEKRFMIN